MTCRAPGGRNDAVFFLQWSLSRAIKEITGLYLLFEIVVDYTDLHYGTWSWRSETKAISVHNWLCVQLLKEAEEVCGSEAQEIEKLAETSAGERKESKMRRKKRLKLVKAYPDRPAATLANAGMDLVDFDESLLPEDN
ncbi:hypothetical protein PC121_g19469 [Phytophthora cactorum]|nr:hypothetical protein PC121_g19469 [Phytophthora cactorum]